jgi:hypothetical protein
MYTNLSQLMFRATFKHSFDIVGLDEIVFDSLQCKVVPTAAANDNPANTAQNYYANRCTVFSAFLHEFSVAMWLPLEALHHYRRRMQFFFNL